MHVLENGICRTCQPHVFDNGVCVTCDAEVVRALVEALDEIARTRYVRTPAGVRKYGLPIGSPIGGGKPDIRPVVKQRRATLKDRIVAAIDEHLTGRGDGDPFDGFSREHLRKAAKDRGIALDRGEPRESIAAKLLADVGGGRPTAAAKRPPGRQMPVPDRAKPYHRNLDGIEDLARAVEDGQPPKTRRALTGGVSADTELHVLKDGTKVVVKHGGNPEAEHGASMIARALGLDAPRVYRNHRSEVYMDYVDNAKTWDQIREAAGENPGGDLADRYKAVRNTDDAKLIGLLDLMVVNGDRNAGNWMIDDNTGKIIPIDHGHAFWTQYVGQPGRQIRAHAIDGTFSGAYLSEPRRWGPNDLTADDIAEIRSRLEKLRPDFKHIGRERWLNYALAVLDAVEPWALGDRNLVAGVR